MSRGARNSWLVVILFALFVFVVWMALRWWDWAI